MVLVLLLALASSACAATSSVLKHRSAQRTDIPAWATWLPAAVARMFAQPLFLAAVVADVAAVAFQVVALHFGTLSIVQPVLCAALIMSLALTHLLDRTRPSSREMLYAAGLVAGLVTFLIASGAMKAPPTGAGRYAPGILLTVGIVTLVAVGLVSTRRMRPAARARVLAVAVAAIYASTAALMKAVTDLKDVAGFAGVLISWKLWVLLAVAVIGLVLNQVVFTLAPLRVGLPVIASLDPLFSVVIAVFVYGETLHSSAGAILGQLVGGAAMLTGIVLLSRGQAEELEAT